MVGVGIRSILEQNHKCRLNLSLSHVEVTTTEPKNRRRCSYTTGKVTGPSHCNSSTAVNIVKPAASEIEATSEIKITNSDVRLRTSEATK